MALSTALATSRELPLGPQTAATIPDDSTQVVIVRGESARSSRAAVTVYERAENGWLPVATWQGHVGKKGWTTRHVEGDLRTPVGTFTLHDAGGREPDPGTSLRYDQSSAFVPPPREAGFGDSTADAFDYVLAVDYNRVPGRSPLDRARPLGAQRGGGIWLHVDHNGPTHGCVSVPKSGMRELLRRLDPDQHPVVVMGDAVRLGR
jgi:L,D-peptidoglycan transpeptidase YkuD (ErfK/YbiS/YcfS/YnhG family)